MADPTDVGRFARPGVFQRESDQVEDRRPQHNYAPYSLDQMLEIYNGVAGPRPRDPESMALLKDFLEEFERRGAIRLQRPEPPVPPPQQNGGLLPGPGKAEGGAVGDDVLAGHGPLGMQPTSGSFQGPATPRNPGDWWGRMQDEWGRMKDEPFEKGLGHVRDLQRINPHYVPGQRESDRAFDLSKGQQPTLDLLQPPIDAPEILRKPTDADAEGFKAFIERRQAIRLDRWLRGLPADAPEIEELVRLYPPGPGKAGGGAVDDDDVLAEYGPPGTILDTYYGGDEPR